MNNYKIISDFGCDLPETLLSQYGIEVIPTNLHIEGECNTLSNELDIPEFYQKLREKKMIKTSAINFQVFKNKFEEHILSGSDILYIGMSAGLSATFTSAKLAAEELMEQYPERKIHCVDSRSGSGGVGLAAYLAALKKEEGADLEETFAYMQNICGRLKSWFTVDDLFFLKRGGRLRTATAVVGSILMIKPILTVNEEGGLFAWGKARGKKNAMAELVRRAEELAFEPENSIITISHADSLQEAVDLEMMLRTRWDVKDIIITDIGPAFGAHCGPGGLAVFFVGKDPEENTEETSVPEKTNESAEAEEINE